MKVLSVSLVLAFCINAYANAEEGASRDCKKESQRYVQTCQDATTASNMNNHTMGESMRQLAGTDPKVNEGGAMEKRVYTSAFNNTQNSFDTCRQQRKKLKETCEEAYKKEEAGKNDPQVKKEITDNYEHANKSIAGNINGNAEKMAGYRNAAGMAGATVGASAESN